MVVYAIVDVRHQEQGGMLRGETALWHLRFVGGFLQGNQLLSPARTGHSQARNAARKLDMNAVNPTTEPTFKSPQRFSARHAS